MLQNQYAQAVAYPTVPNAYYNYIFFDEQFKYAGSGFSRVGASGEVRDHYAANNVFHDIAVPKNGFVYIYCSNQSPIDVFFDNLQVVHTRSLVLEETSYYPFGLVMAGISSIAAGGLENINKFNKGSEFQHKEFSDGSGLELYETPLRSLDPQLGRWWQIDSKPEYSQSLYSAMSNNPILYGDALGDSILPNVSLMYSKTALPITYSDLGGTTRTEIDVTSATTSNVNITVGVSIELTSAFNGTTRATNIETQNPGLEREVIAHEKGHEGQIMDAANSPINLSIKIDGKKTKFTGSADQVIVDATKAFNKSSNAAKMSTTEKTDFVNNKIGVPALNEMRRNIDKATNASNVESDANNRAASILGANTIRYNNKSTRIIFNGKEIK